MYVIISIQKDHKGVKEFGILPLSGFHQTIREFEMRYTTKLWTAIIFLMALFFWRECLHASRTQHLVSYHNNEIEEILRAYDELADKK